MRDLTSEQARALANARPTKTIVCSCCGAQETKRVSKIVSDLCKRCRTRKSLQLHLERRKSGNTIKHPSTILAIKILEMLNTRDNSPYKNKVKLTSTTGKGKIQIIRAVPALKVLIYNEGITDFNNLDIVEELYNKLIVHFNLYKTAYGDKWDLLSNPFIYSTGFSALVKLLAGNLKNYQIPKKLLQRSHFKYLTSYYEVEKFIMDYLQGIETV